MRKLKFFIISEGIIMFISLVIMYIITYMDNLDDSPYAELSTRLDWFSVLWIIFLISAALLVLVLSVIIIHKITQNMRQLKLFTILDGFIMAISWALMHMIDYISMHDDRYSGLSPIIGWIILLWIIFLISAALLAFSLSIIIIHKIIQNMRKLKIFAIIDSIVMVISWVPIYILDYMGIYSQRLRAGLPLNMGWDLVFTMIFQISSVLLVLALSIIVMHKIINKIIQKTKKINNEV